nr:translation elongation factor Ts [Anaerolineae bacterium]
MTVSAEMVKKLREETGAAVMDCKLALEENDGDFEKAKEYLTQKGLATAKKKADRIAREGLIETYTHHGARVGVMLELNCESDFVAKTEEFKTLAHDLTLHIAFANPAYLSVENVPEEVVREQRKLYEDEAKAQGKPDNIVDRIVDGKMSKFYSEVVLLEQPFIRDDEMTIQDVITQTIAELKENIRVGRFARFELGENPDGLEEKE